MVDLTPYAQALYDAAAEANQDEQIHQELMSLAVVWKENPSLVQVLKHPKIKREQKEKVLRSILDQNIDPLLTRFVQVLNRYDLAGSLEAVSTAYQTLYDQSHQIERVEVETASKLDAKQIEALKAVLKEKLQKEVHLDIQVDPSLIAGMRVHTNQFVLDNTILSRAEKMKETIKKK